MFTVLPGDGGGGGWLVWAELCLHQVGRRRVFLPTRHISHTPPPYCYTVYIPPAYSSSLLLYNSIHPTHLLLLPILLYIPPTYCTPPHFSLPHIPPTYSSSPLLIATHPTHLLLLPTTIRHITPTYSSSPVLYVP